MPQRAPEARELISAAVAFALPLFDSPRDWTFFRCWPARVGGD